MLPDFDWKNTLRRRPKHLRPMGISPCVVGYDEQLIDILSKFLNPTDQRHARKLLEHCLIQPNHLVLANFNNDIPVGLMLAGEFINISHAMQFLNGSSDTKYGALHHACADEPAILVLYHYFSGQEPEEPEEFLALEKAKQAYLKRLTAYARQIGCYHIIMPVRLSDHSTLSAVAHYNCFKGSENADTDTPTASPVIAYLTRESGKSDQAIFYIPAIPQSVVVEGQKCYAVDDLSSFLGQYKKFTQGCALELSIVPDGPIEVRELAIIQSSRPDVLPSMQNPRQILGQQ